ncbi:hypothetical protein J437_LFUL004156 [Ladona fulva]|uniref:Zinc finger PHD-type domain-containing protein n=1 Tax=Ladona fulva TaxID=123851 RepID=A0A8K0K2B3_LADFU|nr:hypothetical protein J437_LFUL004156 [Ladona fulva]
MAKTAYTIVVPVGRHHCSSGHHQIAAAFMVGDYVDVRSEAFGAWFEGQILDIQAAVLCSCKETKVDKNPSEEDYAKLKKLQEDIIYVVTHQKCPEESEETTVNNLRPKARKICDISTLKPRMVVLVNYNVYAPNERGLWYDFKIAKVRKAEKMISGDLIIFSSTLNVKDINIRIVDNIMKIEKRIPVKERSQELEESMKDPTITKISIECRYCQDDNTKLCGACGCVVCGSKEEPENQLVCDECNKSFHLKCLIPPLDAIPDDDWYVISIVASSGSLVFTRLNLGDLHQTSAEMDYFPLFFNTDLVMFIVKETNNYGCLGFKQYIPSNNKRHRFGLKLLILYDCETGIVLDVIVYTRKKTEISQSGELGLLGEVVKKLLENI